MTTVAEAEVSADYARRLTDRIKVAVEGTWHLIEEAYQSRAWAALGYKSWDDYMTREFGTSRLRLPREERTEVVASLRDSGLSIRAIAAVTGNSVNTVQSDLRQVSQTDTPAKPEPLTGDHLAETIDAELRASDPDYAETAAEVTDSYRAAPQPVRGWAQPEPKAEPQKVTGTDGKQYTVPTPAPKQERRADLPSSARTLSTDLHRLVNRLIKLREDDRLSRNAVQVASLLRSDLSDAIEVCQDLLDAFPAN